MEILAHGPSTQWPPVYFSHWDQANQMDIYEAITQSFSCTGIGDLSFHQEHNYVPSLVAATVGVAEDR